MIDVVFITEQEAAVILGISYAALKQWRLRASGFPFRVYRLGHRVRYRLADVTGFGE